MNKSDKLIGIIKEEISKSEISVFTKIQFGSDKYYPFDDTAKLFLELMRTATFSRVSLQIIRELGYTVYLISRGNKTELK